MTNESGRIASLSGSDAVQATEFFDVYKDHSNVLRTWLTAYGVGVPVLMLSQEKIWSKVVSAGLLEFVAALFLFGVVIQVILLSINKYVMWSCYYGTISKLYAQGRWYSLSASLSCRAWVDLVVDIISIVCFAIGTYFCFESLVSY